MDPETYREKKKQQKGRWALAGEAQWTECQPANQRFAVSIPSQGTCLGCRPGPQWGAHKRQPHTDVSHPPFCLKINKWNLQKKKKRKKSRDGQGRSRQVQKENERVAARGRGDSSVAHSTHTEGTGRPERESHLNSQRWTESWAQSGDMVRVGKLDSNPDTIPDANVWGGISHVQEFSEPRDLETRVDTIHPSLLLYYMLLYPVYRTLLLSMPSPKAMKTFSGFLLRHLLF